MAGDTSLVISWGCWLLSRCWRAGQLCHGILRLPRRYSQLKSHYNTKIYELKSCVASWSWGRQVAILLEGSHSRNDNSCSSRKTAACSGRKQVNMAFSWRHFPSHCKSPALVHCVVVGWNEQLCVSRGEA